MRSSCFARLAIRCPDAHLSRMNTFRAVLFPVLLLSAATAGACADPVRTGEAAFGDWRGDAPGVVRHITPDSLPAPFAARSAAQSPSVVARPAGAAPHV